MNRPILFLIVLMSLISWSATGQRNPFNRDIGVLTNWFEGEFDNDSQIWFESRADGYENLDRRHDRIHTKHIRIEHPEIGLHVFEVQTVINEDSTKKTIRLVSFETDLNAGGIRMTTFQNSSTDKWEKSPGCDILLTRSGDQFHGYYLNANCPDQLAEIKDSSGFELIVSESKYWFSGKFEPFKLRRANYYNCELRFYKKYYAEPTKEDTSYQNLLVHNQGGFAWVDHPFSDKRYGIQIREKEYPFYNEGSDFFMLRFIEEGKKISDVIVTAEPGVKKISFQIGWVSAACKLVE